ncbi:MAG: GntR family transcriptional regulator [Firmicutes bacterium]|jgi:GntR family transcriptional regulator|nr:GntR family transcriptional regulator [Bacillota bacterium]
MVLVKENSPVALYYQLKSILAQKIMNNEWQVGDRLPSEFELCKEYGVSRITVRQALAELEKDGLVKRRQGVGTFVTLPKIEQQLTSFYSFSEEFRKRGLNPRNEVEKLEIIVPTAKIAKALDIQQDEEIYYLKRLRYADETLMAIEATYLPVRLFPGLSKAELDTTPLYDVMRNKYGVVVDSAKETFGAVAINRREAELFQLPPGHPALDLERFTYAGDQCVEYTVGVVRGDRFRFEVKLN